MYSQQKEHMRIKYLPKKAGCQPARYHLEGSPSISNYVHFTKRPFAPAKLKKLKALLMKPQSAYSRILSKEVLVIGYASLLFPCR